MAAVAAVAASSWVRSPASCANASDLEIKISKIWLSCRKRLTGSNGTWHHVSSPRRERSA